MTHVLDPCIHQFVILYLDDIYIYSKSPEQHFDHLQQVLTALRDNKLYIKMVKCFWAKRETDYLGFFVGNCIVRTSLSKVTAVKDWPLLETQNQLNLLWFFARFIVSLFITLRIVRLH